MTDDADMNADIDARVGRDANDRDAGLAGASARSDAPAPEVLGLIADVERMLGRLRSEADESDARARERDRLARAVLLLEEERARLLERQLGLESQLATTRATLAEREGQATALAHEVLALRARAAAAEAARATTSEGIPQTAIESAPVSARDLDTLRRERDEAQRERDEAQRERDEAQRERDEAREALMRAARRLTELADLNESQADRLRELESEQASNPASARAADPDFDRNSESEPESNVTSLDAAEIDRLASERARAIVAPRLAQMSEIANFLRTRRERLAALRQALKARAKAQRVLRQVYAESIDPGSRFAGDADVVTVADATANAVVETRARGAGTTASGSEPAEPAIHAFDRSVSLDAPFEGALGVPRARVAHGSHVVAAIMRSLGLSLGLALTALASWHLAGLLAPQDVLATVEIEVSDRNAAATSTPAASSMPTSTSAPVDAAPVAEWLRARLSDGAFAGAVAVRLADRGHGDDDAMERVAGLGERASVDVVGDRITIALSGAGAAPTAELLDVVATSVVFEANRDPARRDDALRLGIANARPEVGRTVFAHVEPADDSGRLVRSAWIAGGFLALAGILVALFRGLARPSDDVAFAR